MVVSDNKFVFSCFEKYILPWARKICWVIGFHLYSPNIRLTDDKFSRQHFKITHMWRRWGTTQNLFLAFTDELEKQLFIKKKNCWSQPFKKQNNFNIYNNAFFKKMKIKKNTWKYYYFTPAYKNINDMIYSSWDVEHDRIKLVILPFYSPKKPKN